MSFETEKRFVVEIGSGERPFPTISDRVLNPDECYVGVDNSLHDGTFKRALERIDNTKQQHKGSLNLIRCDGRALPFKSSCVTEVVFSNVFGYLQITPGDHKAMLKEAKRVLSDKGTITIVETYTPWEAPSDGIRRKLKKYGFESTPEQNIHCEEDITQYHAQDGFDVTFQPSFSDRFYRWYGYRPELPYVAKFVRSMVQSFLCL